MVTSRSVRAAVSEHLNCPTAPGGPLEDEGGISTAGSHWEAAIFQTEIMVGVSSSIERQRQVLSNVTLALAQDSGWYAPNFGAAGFLRFGHLTGCDMLVCPPPCSFF
jgi:leishmanolysin-like peptidase